MGGSSEKPEENTFSAQFDIGHLGLDFFFFLDGLLFERQFSTRSFIRWHNGMLPIELDRICVVGW